MLRTNCTSAAPIISRVGRPASTIINRSLSSRVDVHTHVVPPFWGEALADHGGDPSGWMLPKWTAEDTMQFMDKLNISTKMLSVTAPGVTGWKASERPGMCRKINEFTQNVGERNPGKFGNLASIPLPDAEASVKEAEYALDTLGADGIVVYTNYEGVYLGDKKFDPVWETLNDRNAVVFIHPGAPELKVIPGQPGPLCDYPFDSARNAVHMVNNGVLRKYPNIKFILSHAGGFVPYASLRFSELSAGLYPDGPTAEERLSDYKKFYFDTALSSGPYAIPTLVKFAGLDHVLFGSDHPYASDPISIKFTEWLDTNSGLSKEDVATINTNGAKLFPRFANSLR